jgi:hypothetical protein
MRVKHSGRSIARTWGSSAAPLHSLGEMPQSTQVHNIEEFINQDRRMKAAKKNQRTAMAAALPSIWSMS